MTKFEFADNAIFTGKGQLTATKVGKELERITKEHGGALTPPALVEASADPSALLHRCFEWDDSAAGQKYREQQARMIITSIRRVDTPGSSVRAFVSIAADPEADEPRSYRPIDVVLQSPNLRAEMLRAAQRDLEAFERRYAELKEVVAHVARARKALDKLQSKEDVTAVA